MKIIYIEWADAISSGSPWISADELEDWLDNSEWMIKHVGFLLKETKEYILLASKFKPDDKWSISSYGHIQKIPKTWIRKKEVLGETQR